MYPVRLSWFYTYVLKCEKTGTFYTGCTNDLKQRIEQHTKGKVCYTKHRLPIKLIYSEACLNKDDAYRRERYLKTGIGKRYIKNRLKGWLTDGMNPVRPL
ncbi:MAG: GIY-YIG nuclease family protein [Phycisphaerae bacterium]